MPKRKVPDPSEFPLGANIVDGSLAKKLWAVLEDEHPQVAANTKDQLKLMKGLRSAVSMAPSLKNGTGSAPAVGTPLQQDNSLEADELGDVRELCYQLSSSLAGTVMDLGGSTIEAPSSSSTTASRWRRIKFWPEQNPVSCASLERGLFTPGIPAAEADICTMTGSGTTVKGGSLVLAQHNCIVLDTSCSGVTYSGMTLQGGVVVCHGADCSVSFIDTQFVGCTLVALQGATVTLTNCNFTHSTNGPIGVSIFATGARTVVTVDGGSITGGAEGAVVHKGAHLNAKDLTVSQCFVAGIECRDPGSTIELSDCTISNLSQQCIEIVDISGVLAQSGCKATFTECKLEAVPYGIDVQSKATATMTRCHASGCRVTGLSVSGGAQANIAECTVQRCGVAGVHIFEKDTNASVMDCELTGNLQHGVLVSNFGRGDVHRCQMTKNGSGGAWVSFDGQLSMSHCKSIGNSSSGYWAESGNMTIIDCTSLRDGDCGCGSFGVPLQCVRVKVEKCRKDGFLFQGGATALMSNCVVKDCGRYGVYAQTENTKVGIEGGTVERNSFCGVCVEDGACASVAKVQSSGNSKAGFRSAGKGSKMQLQSCVSGDSTAYKCDKDGTLHAFECLPQKPTSAKKHKLLESIKAELEGK